MSARGPLTEAKAEAARQLRLARVSWRSIARQLDVSEYRLCMAMQPGFAEAQSRRSRTVRPKRAPAAAPVAAVEVPRAAILDLHALRVPITGIGARLRVPYRDVLAVIEGAGR